MQFFYHSNLLYMHRCGKINFLCKFLDIMFSFSRKIQMIFLFSRYSFKNQWIELKTKFNRMYFLQQYLPTKKSKFLTDHILNNFFYYFRFKVRNPIISSIKKRQLWGKCWLFVDIRTEQYDDNIWNKMRQ